MQWSHERPIQTGFFWFRDSKRGVHEQVVEVETVPKMGLVAQKELFFDGELLSTAPKTCEWAGPIQRPE